MRKTSKIDLIGVPYPVNLLECSRHADEMRPGEELVITLADADVRDNLILILRAMDDIEFDVSNVGRCYQINATKKGSDAPGNDVGITGGI